MMKTRKGLLFEQDPLEPPKKDPLEPPKKDPLEPPKKEDPKKEDPKKEDPKKVKERKVDLVKCRKSIEEYYPDKEKYQRDFSFEEVEDAFEREEGKNADQILYSKGTEKRQKQMCARWEDGWRPNFGKPCDETFPIEKWCNNDLMKEIQKCLGLPADRRTGIFDDLTMSKLRAKGITPEESEDISQDEYKKLCNKYTSKEQLPSDELFESKIMKINYTEKSEILKKHLDFKNILQEQKRFLERGLIMEQNVPEIESAKAQGCISKTGRYAVRRAGKNSGKTAWVITATKDGQKWKIGDDIWIYPNGECEVFDQTEFTFHENCWSCDKARQSTQDKTVEDYKVNGWQEYDEITENFKEKDNPKFFVKVAVTGAKDGFMYFPVWEKNITLGSFPVGSEQQKFLSGLTQTYGTITINPDLFTIENNDLRPYVIPTGNKLFANGLTVYYDPTKAKAQDPSTIRAQTFIDATKISIVKCEQYIQNYWESYRRGLVNPERFMFQEQKELVQACARQYYDQWKPQMVKNDKGEVSKETIGGVAGIGGGRVKLNKILRALAGVEDYDGTQRAPLNIGRRPNPWRITLPNV